MSETSNFNYARAAGLAYLSLVFLGAFPEFFVRMALKVPCVVVVIQDAP